MQSMDTSLSALSAYDKMMSVTANNLANLNTSGFKTGTVDFSDTFYQTMQGATAASDSSGGVNPLQIGSGVKVGAIDTRFDQGTFSSTGIPTNVALFGDGFFAVQRNGVTTYTRDGSFQIDATGHLVHSGTGAAVLGWMADDTGAVSTAAATQPITIPTSATLTAQPTSTVQVGGNLAANSAVGDTVPMSFTVYDSQGGSHVVSFNLTQAGANKWSWQATVGGAAAGSGSVQFNAAGTWQSGAGTISFDPGNGATNPQTIAIDMKQLTQLAADNSASAVNQDGFAPGSLTNILVDAHGVITGHFSNGVTRPLARIGVAVFPNRGGLERTGDNMFLATGNSGLPQFTAAGTGKAGEIQAGGVESSTVDLAQELTNVLVAQRGFQAAARLITAGDELTQEALNLRR